MPVFKIKKDGAWQEVAGVSGHSHSVGQIVDFPDMGEFATQDYVGMQISGLASQMNIPWVEPADDDIPKVFINGVIPTTKDDVLAEMDYISKTHSFHAYLKIKCQGTSSMAYPKKNFTVKLYSDEDREVKLKKTFKDWGVASNKYVLKANFIDHSHARNIICANLWSEVVASRQDYNSLPVELRNSPCNGAIDGFPIKVYTNDTYQGIYTWNIGKDDWMWGMDEDNQNHVLLCAETNTNNEPEQANTPCNFRTLWGGVDGVDWSVEVGANSTAVQTSLNNLISFVMQENGEAFRSGIGQYLDIKSAIDYYIHQYVICGLDGLAKNMLLATYDGTKWMCGAYDMDSTFGLWWDGAVFVPADYRCPEDYQERYGLLWERIESLFASALKSRYAELRKSVYSFGNIVSKFERFTDLIGTELYKEDAEIYTSIPLSNDNNIKQIRSYIRDRLAYVDAQINALGNVPCSGITLSTNVLSFNGAEKHALTATITPVDTTDDLMWSSSNIDVATVYDGVVTAVSNGTAIITAICGSYTANCTVTVSGIQASGILAETELHSGFLSGTTGEVMESSTDWNTDLISCANAKYLYMTFVGENVGNNRIVFYDEYGNYVSGQNNDNADGTFVQVPDTAKYFRLSIYNAGTVATVRLMRENVFDVEPVKDGAYSNDLLFNAGDTGSCTVEIANNGNNLYVADFVWGAFFIDKYDSCFATVDVSTKLINAPTNAAKIALCTTDGWYNEGVRFGAPVIASGMIIA